VRRIPLHPLLFATFPILFLFVQNADRVRFAKVTWPWIVVLVCTTVVTAIAGLVFRSLRRGAIVGSGFAILSLSYGHMWTAVQDKAILGLVVGRDMFLLPFWALLGAGVVLFAWRVKSIGEVTAIVNVVAAGLVVVSAVNTSSAIASQSEQAFQANTGALSEEIPVAKDEGTKRDIYYMIYDRYGSGPVLKEFVNFDNSEFLDGLRKRGFYVADDAQSNYPTTAHSVASSLNMQYLDDLAERMGKDSKDWKPLYRTIPGSKVSRFLQGQGYSYAHVGSWYDPTASDKTAQVNYHYDKTSEFTRVLIQTTLMQPLAKRIGLLKEFDGRQVIHNQILFQFDSILDAAKLRGPTFTFSHILLPHEPFTFTADGGYLTEDESVKRSWEEGYTGQVKFANRKILTLLDKLLDVPDERKPIIIIQADEGPKRYEWTYGGRKRWEDATDDQLREKVGILDAYYLPGGGDAGLYQDITPVNSFRKVFNLYFGTDLPYLPDRNYVYGTGEEPYRLTDITDRVNP
jgi:sulfatase-like protein